jgi:Pheromone A receptor
MSGQDLSYLYPLYPIVGGIAIILCAIPIPAHWRAGNIATIMLGLWDLGMAIIVWIGTIVWHNNVDNPNPIWGDIVNFYYAMFPTALASTTFCIQYRLWSIARARSVFITKKEVRIVTFLLFYWLNVPLSLETKTEVLHLGALSCPTRVRWHPS